MPTTNADGRINPQIDARRFEAILEEGGVDASTLPWSNAHTARQELQAAASKLYDARAAIMGDSTRTQAERQRVMSEAVDKAFARVSRRLSGAEEQLRRRSRQADAAIGAAIKERTPAEAQEIRAYIRGLEDRPKRLEFLRKAIRSGDTATAAAVLGAPSYLSGLDGDTIGTVQAEAERAVAPDEAHARDVSAKAADEIGRAFNTFTAETRKMVDMAEAARAREEREKSEAAIQAATGAVSEAEEPEAETTE